jgi:phosphoribosylamine--glycine ligase
MNVLVVGNGAREHAICWKLCQSKKLKELFCTPGNGGIGQIATIGNVQSDDIAGLVEYSKVHQIDFVVVGPEVPLAMGLVDHLEKAGIPAFGPNKECAQLEASKIFTKRFLQRHQIPTAEFVECYSKEECLGHLGLFSYPMVLKADGLAGGKGVLIVENEKAARSGIDSLMDEKIFGAAGDRVIIEEYLSGTEASILCFVDETRILPMDSCQDYKRIGDQDRGPNTGGMGSYSPSALFCPTHWERLSREILEPTLQGFQEEGLGFKGLLFIGLMWTNQGWKVIEFNNRFGDPETQSLLPRLKNDLLEILLATRENRLSQIELEWDPRVAVTVNVVSKGYPGKYETGKEIRGLDQVDPEILIFHGGTVWTDPAKGETGFRTGGGRVVSVTSLGETMEKVRQKVYDNVGRIQFDGAFYRKDIGVFPL